MNVYRHKFGEEDFEEVLKISKMSAEEAIEEMIKELEKLQEQARENEDDE